MCCLFLPQFFSGGWTSQSANSLRIVGDLMLVQPDGSLISAKGLEYSGPDLNYQTSGIVLLSAIYEPFSLEGEILDNPIIIPNGPYPNHCRTIFPSTTHRLEVWGESGQISTSSYYSILHENDFIIIIFFPEHFPYENDFRKWKISDNNQSSSAVFCGLTLSSTINNILILIE